MKMLTFMSTDYVFKQRNTIYYFFYFILLKKYSMDMTHELLSMLLYFTILLLCNEIFKILSIDYILYHEFIHTLLR